MKILIIMAGFFPGQKYGGPSVSVDNFCSLMSECECYIVTHNHDMGESVPYAGIVEGTWIDRGNCNVMYLSNEDYGKHQFESVITEIRPDIIYLQGLFQQCILPCLQLAKKYKIKVLLAPRGELCGGAFKKKYKKIPYIVYLRVNGLIRSISFQSTSDEETESIQKYLGADKKRINYLTNIPSIPRQVHEHSIKEPRKARFIFLSRVHPKKNLLSAIRYFENISGSVKFDIYGPLEDESYWNECLKEIEKLPKNIEVQYRGLVSHDKVHEIFSKYDAFLFPTLSENYGHVIAEALIVGCPVIISDQTPWNDVNEYNVGWAIPLRDEKGFCNAIQQVVNTNSSFDSDNIQTYISKKIKIDQIGKEYKSVLEQL